VKILQILPQLNCGGVEVGTIDLAQALIARGHRAYVISAGGELVPRLIKMGAHHYELPVDKKSFKTLATIGTIRGIIEKERIDIVHARSRVPAWVAYLATRPTNAKFVTTCHGYYSKHLMSTIMGWGERVIVISRAVGRRMIDDFHVLPERIRLIHRGVDTEMYGYDNQRYSKKRLKAKERFIIANIGRLTPIKGHEYFIRAIHLLSHQYPQIEAWIVGGSSKRKAKYCEQLKVLVAKLGMTNNVKFMGVEDNVPELLKKVDMLVLSTTYPEGFGRVIIEAGASGVAVVATKVGGVPDIIEDGVHGLLVSPQDEYKMSEAMVRIMHDPGLAHTLAANLRKKVEKFFTVEQMIDKTIAVYEEVRQTKRILVIKLGAFGDIVLAVPSLRMIRKKYPQAFIAVLVDAGLTATLEQCPYIDEVIPFKRHDKRTPIRTLNMLAKKLRKYSFDISVDFQNTTKTHLVAALAGIPARYGYKRGLFGRFLTHGVGSFDDPLAPVAHQFRVLNLLGVTECDERLELWPQEDEKRYIRCQLDQDWIKNAARRVGFVLGASTRWQSKKWPLEYYLDLAERLVRDCNCVVILIGDETASDDRDHFLMRSKVKVLDLIGKTSMAQLVALMGSLDCLVCGDTAPLHVATAMNTKTVCLFGPTDPRRHVPSGGKNSVLRRNLSCAPCYEEQCKEDHRCMREITVDEVFDTLLKQLGIKHVQREFKVKR
jgi:lipopolysaccharide heptosyltransferase II